MGFQHRPEGRTKRSTTVAAGASGTRTGRSVDSLTERAAWGRQNRAVAYQLPSVVVDASSAWRSAEFERSRRFFVA